MASARSSSPPQAAPLSAGILAYVTWGFFPLYFKLLSHISPLVVVSHRILWSALFLLPLVISRKVTAEIRRICSDFRTLRLLILSSVLIFLNWLVFVRVVERGEVLQSSIGYFLTPIVNLLLGVTLLRERLSRRQFLAVLLAAAGVALQVAAVGVIPVSALMLAATFGCYGLVRKVAKVEPVAALTVETVLLSPPCALLLLFLSRGRVDPFGGDPNTFLLLAGSGVITALPLICFGAAARSLRLSTIGFLQYLTPSLHFVQAVFLFGEQFGPAELSGFLLVWGGLAIYSIDALAERLK